MQQRSRSQARCAGTSPEQNLCRRFLAALLGCSVLVLAACDSGDTPGSDGGVLGSIRSEGELVILTRNAPTIYYVGRDGLAGPEYDMTAAFAESLGVEPRYRVMDSVDEILSALRKGDGHIAAAGLTHTDVRTDHFLTGPAYQTVRQQVVCRRGGKRPKTVEALTDVELVVVARSSYAERLTELKKNHPQLTWRETEDADTEDLLARVWRRKFDCTVADSNIVSINRRYHPELVVTFDLTKPEPLVWYMVPGAESLKSQVQSWFSQFRARGQLADVLERYYGFVDLFDYVDTRRFVRAVRKRLPRYRELFEQAGKEYGLKWTLLAAQSYQESHWRPRAKSPTGVRGLMMLTLRTADELGVDNRLEPKQSVFGGARYLADLRDRLPEEIDEPDRTWIALAAYNVGMGHIYDARRLAEGLGKDPNTWTDLKEVLPLLSRKRYYKTLKYGYARGNEPVRYVSRIRNFEDMLVRRLRRNSK